MTDDDLRFTQRALRYFELDAVDVEVDPNVADLHVRLGGDVPVVVLGQGFLESDVELRHQKVVHELLHCRGLMHEKRARELGYYSNPRRDRLSALVRDDIESGRRRFDPGRFGL